MNTRVRRIDRIPGPEFTRLSVSGIVVCRAGQAFIATIPAVLLNVDVERWLWYVAEDLFSIGTAESVEIGTRLNAWLSDPAANASGLDWLVPPELREMLMPHLVAVRLCRDIDKTVDGLLEHATALWPIDLPDPAFWDQAAFSSRKEKRRLKEEATSSIHAARKASQVEELDWLLFDGQIGGPDDRMAPRLFVTPRLRPLLLWSLYSLAAYEVRSGDKRILSEAVRIIVDRLDFLAHPVTSA